MPIPDQNEVLEKLLGLGRALLKGQPDALEVPSYRSEDLSGHGIEGQLCGLGHNVAQDGHERNEPQTTQH
jgi:hypothetical protein